MNRLEKILSIRGKLRNGKPSVGSWMQIPDGSVAEIMGQGGYDWVAVDMEHGAIGFHQLPDLFRALELGNTLPMARLAEGTARNCKAALDAGAGGVIIPMMETAKHAEACVKACRWPPAGTRGVGFSRANLFGRFFDAYSGEAQQPLVICQIEHVKALRNLDQILQVAGVDAIMIGPYDLSASMGLTGQFDHPEFQKAMVTIQDQAARFKKAAGLHVVLPSPEDLEERINQNFLFIAYGIDTVFLEQSSPVTPYARA